MQAVGVSSAAVCSPQAAQVHTGRRCPHQSWREMHQSWMFSIQCRYTRPHRCGTKRTRPSRTAAIAGLTSSPIRMNHWRERSGSMIVWQRSQVPTL